MRVLEAFALAVASLFHPRMVRLMALPLVLALVVWLAVGWWLWGPVTESLHRWLAQWAGPLGPGSGWWVGVLGALGGIAVALAGFILLVPLVSASTLLAMAIVAQPIVMRFVSERVWPDVEVRGAWSPWGSVFNALRSLAIFVPGYLLTIPLWVFPGAGLVVPWLWWGWLNARLLGHDSLGAHADPKEMREILARHRGAYLAMGALTAALNYVFPLFLVMPLLGALAFGHLSLALLRDHRARGASGGPRDPMDPRDPRGSAGTQITAARVDGAGSGGSLKWPLD